MRKNLESKNKEFMRSIIEICEKDGQFPVRGSHARRKIKISLRRNGYSTDDIRAFWSQPEKMLGPFDELPTSFRKSLANSAHFHIQESNLLTSPVVLKLARGTIFNLGGAIVHQGWKIKEGHLPWLGFRLIQLGRIIISMGVFLGRVFLKLFRFTRFYKAPIVHMLWKYAKLDPWIPIQDYIKGIPLDPRLSPVFKCAKRKVISCGLVGLDLLPSNGKLYFLESNFNPGHYIERHRLFPQGDTVCIHLVKWANENGFRHIVFYPSNFDKSFDWNLEQAWQEIVSKENLRLEVIDDPLIGSPWPRRRELFMDDGSAETLYINGRFLNSPLSRLIGRKDLIESEIIRFNESVVDEKKIPIPRRINNNNEVPRIEDGARFPNIIIKNAIVDQAKGITLYKMQSLHAGVNTWPNIAYEYVIPDLILHENHNVIKEYVFIFRAYMLITPDGPVYFGARKDVSSVPVPKLLPFGPVKDKLPYVTNINLGAYSVPHSEMEDRACREAVLSIGSVVFNFLRKKHILTVNQ